jgi:hypothetical protein
MVPELITIFAGLTAYIVFFAMLGVPLFNEEYNA